LDYTALADALSDLTTARRWLVALSGGIDSTVLLHLLADWRDANPGLPPLAAVHVNHGLQAAAGDWQRHCESLCAQLDIELITRTVDAAAYGAGESAAREARYAVFDEVVQADEVLLLAHHLDDQVETFFLRLMRGAGVEGLAGMPARRAVGGGQLVRPMLGFARSEIQACATQRELRYIEDPSNADSAIDRNFLRNEVLPLLEGRWPAYRATVSRAAGHMSSAGALLAAHAGEPETIYTEMGDPGLAELDLLSGSDEEAATRLRAWLRQQAVAAPDQAGLTEFLRQLRSGAPDSAPRLVVDARVMQRYRQGIYLLPQLAAATDLSLSPGECVSLPGIGRLAIEATDGPGFALAPQEILRIGWRDSASRVRLLGRSHSSSLKQLLQDGKVPPWWRGHVPLLWVGDELLAIGDLARCESPRWRLGLR